MIRSSPLRATIERHRRDIDVVLSRYGACRPRLFGSVARGEDQPDSDIDLLVDLGPESGNALMAVAGLSEELTELLGVRVDVVTESLLRSGVSAAARADLVAL